jgi:branched-subunit amino acid ABC-type transport system permease component
MMRRWGRRARAVATIAAASAPTIARASGHELNALGDLITLVGACVAAVPWLVSCALLARKPTPLTWVLGTGFAVAAAIAAGLAELPSACVAVAALPAVAHLVKRIRANLAEASPSPSPSSGQGPDVADGRRE